MLPSAARQQLQPGTQNLAACGAPALSCSAWSQTVPLSRAPVQHLLHLQVLQRQQHLAEPLLQRRLGKVARLCVVDNTSEFTASSAAPAFSTLLAAIPTTNQSAEVQNASCLAAQLRSRPHVALAHQRRQIALLTVAIHLQMRIGCLNAGEGHADAVKSTAKLAWLLLLAWLQAAGAGAEQLPGLAGA